MCNNSFLALLDLEAADAKSIFGSITAKFEKEGVPLGNTLGFGPDGANAMIGRHNSVLLSLLGKQSHLFNIHCVCHVAHLCVSDACKTILR